MQLRTKVCIPIAAITLAIGICCYFIIQKQFESLNETNIQNLVEAKSSQMQQAIELCSEQAMRMAALMSRMPEVEAAYKKALEGDINDENSAASQQGREMLRKSLAPMLDGFTAVIGEKPQIHYHLPPARSFARLWRDKQRRIQLASATPSKLNEKARWYSPLASPSNQRLRGVWAMHTLPGKNGTTSARQ